MRKPISHVKAATVAVVIFIGASLQEHYHRRHHASEQ
jgi:hypothetical protein